MKVIISQASKLLAMVNELDTVKLLALSVFFFALTGLIISIKY